MGLDIGLTNYIKAHFIAHFDKLRNRRIMRSPDAVDVKFLHKHKVFAEFFFTLTPASEFTCIMVVDAQKFNRNAVYEKFVILRNSDIAKPRFQGKYLTVFFKDKGV